MRVTSLLSASGMAELRFLFKLHFAPWMLVFASAAMAVTAYLQALDYPFVSDDRIQIEGNAKLAELHPTELWRLFAEPYNAASEFLPLRDFSYWLDLKLFGLNPAAFHAHNIVLYLLCLPLVYGVTLKLWQYFRLADSASAPWAAATVTALFALHPALVESVVWITGRKYVLPNLFSLLALWFAVNVRRERNFFTPYVVAALLSFVAVMLSKASYFSVAPVIAMLWVIYWYDIPKMDRRRSLLLWPLAILLLASVLLLIFIFSSSGTSPPYWGSETVVRTLAVLGWLTGLAVSPESRHFFYPVGDPYLSGMVALGGVVLISAVAGMLMLLGRKTLEGFAVVVFVLLCIPNLQLIPYGAPSLVQDRFLALAVWPIVLIIVSLSWRLKRLPRSLLLLFIALLWGAQTIERPRDWRSFEGIIDADLRANPGYFMPAVFKIVGSELPQGRYQEAGETAAKIIAPEYRDIMVKLINADQAVNVDARARGNSDAAMNRLQDFGKLLKQVPVEAQWNSPVQVVWIKCQSRLIKLWLSLAQQFPGDVRVRYNAGIWMAENGFYKDSVVQLNAAIGTQRLPESLRGPALKNLGLALIGVGRINEAEAPLRAALEQYKTDAQTNCLLAVVYQLTNRSEAAIRAEAACSLPALKDAQYSD